MTSKKADFEYILVSDAKAGSTNTLLLCTHTHTYMNKCDIKSIITTWCFTLADIVSLPQPCVSVAGQILSNHLTFSQQGDDNGD